MASALEREWAYVIGRARKAGKVKEAEAMEAARDRQEERLTRPERSFREKA